MSYRVLARAYRSKTFDEIVGQDAIATTLTNAITSGRVHHGYLFTGTRGVGKTSMARILAKALNCLSTDAPTVTPCCTCESCVTVAEGEDVDVVEIDAASNTGVDNIRELRNNAMFRPARSRFKIYIIDEVHMLSTGAFNALLKTLEEPPPHVKFILATTEVHKVPATIQSRCQRFDFRAIDTKAITAHLAKLLKAEKIEAEEAVLRRIARLANGSMRDALSLLDKVLSYESKKLTTTVLNEIVPPPHDELAAAVMARVAENDAAGALRALDTALQSGRTVERFCDHLVEHARTLMLLHICGEDTDLVDVPDGMRPELAERAGAFDGPTYVYLIALLEELRRNVKFSGAARALAEAAVVRMAMCRRFTDINALIEQLDTGSEPAEAGTPAAAPKKKGGGARDVTQPVTAPDARPPADRRPGDTPTVAGSDASPLLPGMPRADASAAPSGAAAIIEDPAQPRRMPPKPLSSDEKRRVEADPLVIRAKEAVDGTLNNTWRRAAPDEP